MENEMFQEGDTVRKFSGDYQFVGTVDAVVKKRSGQVRYVVENDDGLLLILNGQQLKLELPGQMPLAFLRGGNSNIGGLK
jgi:hypothetical protein